MRCLLLPLVVGLSDAKTEEDGKVGGGLEAQSPKWNHQAKWGIVGRRLLVKCLYRMSWMNRRVYSRRNG